MATQTETLINTLNVEVATLKVRVATLHNETELVRALANQVAVLQAQLAEMTKTRDVWGQRGWTVPIACSAAEVSRGGRRRFRSAAYCGVVGY